ncbi:MAG: hypothetical protein ACLP3B_05220 [Syntrophobacteraceae bacterium]
MSNLLELIDGLRASGVHLAAEGDRLRYRAPKGVLTDEIKQALVNHKPGIIRLLQAGTTTSYREGPPYPDDRGLVKCLYCVRLNLVGHKAICRISGESKMGIALLIECFDFAMTTVH